MKDWDTLYKSEKNPWGADPTLLLKNYLHLFSKDLPVLDLGCGSGRNALYLANAEYFWLISNE